LGLSEELAPGEAGGKAENVIDVEFETLPLLVEKRGKAEGELVLKGVAGAWAIWAMPFVPRSMDIKVVGFVLAATLLNVRGSDK